MDHPTLGTVVRGIDGRDACRDGAGRILVRRRSELPRDRREARPSFRDGRRRAGRADGRPIRRCARAVRTMRNPVTTMKGVEVHDPRFAHYVLDNAPLEELATGFRWI